MNARWIALALAAALAAGTTVAAHATNPNRTGLHWGPARALGAGTARAWVAVDMDGTPASVGVAVDDEALRAARAGEEAVLPLPAEAFAAGAGAQRATFRVRWDRERRAWLVMLDGPLSVAGSPAALSAQAPSH